VGLSPLSRDLKPIGMPMVDSGHHGEVSHRHLDGGRDTPGKNPFATYRAFLPPAKISGTAITPKNGILLTGLLNLVNQRVT